MLRRQAVAGTDGAQVARGEGLAGGNVFDHVERAAEHGIALFAGLAAVVDAAERLPGDAAAVAELLQLLRLQREGGVRRSEERRVGKGWVSKCRIRGLTEH